MAFDFDALDPDVRRRLALLQDLLGAAQKTGREDVEHLVQVLADGLDVTTEEVRELLRTLRELLEGEEIEEETAVATKSTERPRRDARGRRLNKPFGPAPQRQEPTGPRRDRTGKRLDKPFDPRRQGR